MDKLNKEFNKLDIYDKLDFLEEKINIIPDSRLIEIVINYFLDKETHYTKQAQESYNNKDIKSYRYYCDLVFDTRKIIELLEVI